MIRFFQKIFYLLVVASFLSACAGGANPGPDFLGGEEFPGGTDIPNPSESDNPSDNPNPTGDLATLIQNLVIPAAASEAFVTPSANDQSAFYQMIVDILNEQEIAADTLTDLNYKLSRADMNGTIIMALEDESDAGGGTYLFNPTTASNVILEIPHPLHDTNTLDEGVFIFEQIQAKALFIAGTHRCANAASSPCSGTTTACGAEGAYRISDVAHSTENFFHEAHKATHDTLAQSKFIQLHGFDAAADDPSAIVSNGTTTKVGSFAFINQLSAALTSHLSNDQNAVSCNLAADNQETLCGTTNVQGRYTNGTTDECTTTSTGLTGRFLHVEQDDNLRNDSTGWQLIADALSEVF